MAGETISLDFTPSTVDAQGNHVDSETPLYPGYQLVHLVDERGNGSWAVRKVTLRVSARDAQRGIAEETETYPSRYATQAEALAAAKDLHAKDGDGDLGPDNGPLAQAVKNARTQAQAPQAQQPAQESTSTTSYTYGA